MFALIDRFARRRPAPARAAAVRPRRVRLHLESLESRECLSAPEVMLSVLPGQGQQVLLAGHVVDENPGTVTVNFSGVVTGAVTAEPDGSFNFLTTASGLGMVSAVALDEEYLSSQPFQVLLTSTAPLLNLTVTQGPDRTFLVSGQVLDESPGGRIVTFSGAASGSVETADDGSFVVSLLATQLGTLTATTTDPWGLTGSAQALLTNSAPVIEDFEASAQGNRVFVLSGRVVDDSLASAAGLTVTFSGLSSLTGRTAVVQEDGWFYLTVELLPGEYGTPMAVTTDWWGTQSDVVGTIISPGA